MVKEIHCKHNDIILKSGVLEGIQIYQGVDSSDSFYSQQPLQNSVPMFSDYLCNLPKNGACFHKKNLNDIETVECISTNKLCDGKPCITASGIEYLRQPQGIESSKKVSSQYVEQNLDWVPCLMSNVNFVEEGERITYVKKEYSETICNNIYNAAMDSCKDSTHKECGKAVKKIYNNPLHKEYFCMIDSKKVPEDTVVINQYMNKKDDMPSYDFSGTTWEDYGKKSFCKEDIDCNGINVPVCKKEKGMDEGVCLGSNGIRCKKSFDCDRLVYNTANSGSCYGQQCFSGKRKIKQMVALPAIPEENKFKSKHHFCGKIPNTNKYTGIVKEGGCYPIKSEYEKNLYTDEEKMYQNGNTSQNFHQTSPPWENNLEILPAEYTKEYDNNYINTLTTELVSNPAINTVTALNSVEAEMKCNTMYERPIYKAIQKI